MGHWPGFLGFGGFVGFSAESNIVVNEGILGFGRNFADPKTAQCQGDEEMARLEFAATGAS